MTSAWVVSPSARNSSKSARPLSGRLTQPVHSAATHTATTVFVPIRAYSCREQSLFARGATAKVWRDLEHAFEFRTALGRFLRGIKSLHQMQETALQLFHRHVFRGDVDVEQRA